MPQLALAAQVQLISIVVFLRERVRVLQRVVPARESFGNVRAEADDSLSCVLAAVTIPKHGDLFMKNIFDSRQLKSFSTSLVVILIFACIFRGVFLWLRLIPGNVWPLPVRPYPFEAGWIAHSILAGKGFSSAFQVESGPTALLPPVYPYLLAGIFKVFGELSYRSIAAAATLNEIFSALTCIPIYFIAKRIGGVTLAAVAAWLWAFYPNAIYIPCYAIWYSTLSTLLVALSLWATFAVLDSSSSLAWFGYGALWGVGMLTNPAVGSISLSLLIWLAWNLYPDRRRWFKLPLVAALGVILVCTPWTVRNYKVFGRLIPLRSNFGFELWTTSCFPNDPAGGIMIYDDPAALARYVQIGEGAYMKEMERKAFQCILDGPREMPRLAYRNFLRTWFNTDRPVHSLFFTTRSWFIRLGTNIAFSLLSFAGLILLFRERRAQAWPFAIVLSVFPLVYYITHSEQTYRFPIDPALMVLDGFMLCCIARIAKRRQKTLA